MPRRMLKWLRHVFPKSQQKCSRAGNPDESYLLLDASEVESLEIRLLLSASPPVIAINVDAIADYSTAWVFTDVFQHSRPWISQGFNQYGNMVYFDDAGLSGAPEISLDEQGFPTQLNTWHDGGQVIEQRLATLMFRDIGDQYPSGVYRAEWAGTGQISWGFAAQQIGDVQELGDGRHAVDLQVDSTIEGGIYMRMDATDPADPIQDIHVWMPDYDGQSFAGQVWTPDASFSPYHPLYTERLSPFDTIRFMDWGDINGSAIVDMDDLREVGDARQVGGGRGVAFEYMIALANELDKNVWINMPHQANDEVVAHIAQLFHEQLEPELKVYVEWSNELWNFAFGFDTARWLQEQTLLPENTGLSMFQIAARETKNDFDIWSDEYGEDADRVVRVVAGQAANVDIANQLLQEMDGQFDAIASSAYLQLNEEQRWELQQQYDATGLVTGADVLAKAYEGLAETIGFVQDHQDLAQSYSQQLGRDIGLLIYEGGQHFDARGNANLSYLQALYDAQDDPQIADLYRDLLQGMYDAGVDVFTHFKYVAPDSHFGSWGALKYQEQPTSEAPKYEVLVRATQPGFFNSPPLAVDDSATTGENASVWIDVLQNDSDPDVGDTLSLQSAHVTSGGGSVVSVGDLIEFDPGKDYDGLSAGDVAHTMIEYAVVDSHGAISTAYVDVTIEGENDAPIITALEGPVDAVIGTTLEFSVGYTDPDNIDTSPTITWRIRNEAGDLVDSGGGDNIQFLPLALGTYDVQVMVTDSQGASDVRSMDVNVFVVEGPAAFVEGNQLFIIGTEEDDRITVRQTYNTFLVVINGDVYRDLPIRGHIYIFSLGGDDNINVKNNVYQDANVYAGAGDDLVRGGRGYNRLWGGAGNDRLIANWADHDLLVGGDGDDRLYGMNGADVLIGGAGDDLLVGGHGNDELYGGAGNDKILGGHDDDIIMGDAGNDWLIGHRGNDWIFGGDGDDLIVDLWDVNHVSGGSGFDIFVINDETEVTDP